MLKRLLEELVKEAHPNIEYTVNAHELWKDGLIKRKAFAVLDDLMGGMKQIETLLGGLDKESKM